MTVPPRASAESARPGLERDLRPSVFAAVLLTYAAQGFGYATVATSLPTFKDRIGLTESWLSLILLGVCVAAAAGSMAADLVAVRLGSRWAVALGYLVQAGSLAVAMTTTSAPAFVGAVVGYGIGLGCVDAAANMAGALAQARSARPVFGKLYAAYTLAGILGAIATAALHSTDLPATSTIGAAALTAVVTALVAIGYCDRFVTVEHAPTDSGRQRRPPLPRRAICVVGAVVFAAFVVDAAVSTWSTLYVQDGLGASASIAPLAYATYLAVVFGARVTADPLVHRRGRRTTSTIGAVAALAGCVLVAAVHTTPAAIAGFALAGAAAGFLVPVAFSWAGELAPQRRDEVIARVNLFNYGGAVVGAAGLGAVAGNASALAFGFLLPAIAIAAVLPLVRAHAS